MSSQIITKRFDEVFYLALGRTPSRGDKSYWDGLHTWVSIADMSCGKYISTSKEKITDKALQETNIPIVKKGTVIMSFKLSIGKVCIAESDIYTNEAIMAFKPNNKYTILPEYLYYYLQAYKWDCSNEVVLGFTLNKKSISQSLITFPESLSEQQRIVDILDAEFAKIDDLKENAERNLQNAKDLFQAVLRKELEPKEGWETKHLNEIATYSIGLTYKPDNVSKDGTIVLRSSNIQNAKLDLEDIIRVNCTIKDELYVKDGDILMCSRNGSKRLVGKVAKIENTTERMTFGTFMTIIRSVYNPLLFYFFQSNSFRKQLESGENPMINQITKYMLNDIIVSIPTSIAEQERIVDILDVINNKCEVLQRNYEDTVVLCNDLKQALLRKAFNGEL